ncbi:F-box associated domain-containing protein [Caenorhabditis elegans]|uniref:F-box associated domain-containing protein n=1 Tax=Caenorhabditis elegans TaxID=6239 RepID=B5BM39_CAEEL|nr:F-box associated domain-containing protein [Caenorhabditis elegans]CAR31490.2 F-box associated domain-containing protein [Caenorhabditis elegans]
MPPFPILLLPAKPRQIAIKFMEILDIVNFSLITQNAKNVVISAKLKVSISCFIERDSRIRLKIGRVEKFLPGPSLDQTKFYLEHLMEIFCQKKLKCLTFTDVGIALQVVIGDFDRFQDLILQSGYFSRSSASLKTAREYAPKVECMNLKDAMLTHTVLFNRRFQRGLLVQNFQRLLLPVSFRLNLDDLLLINVKRVGLTAEVGSRDINLFLKHWIAGSNDELDHLSFTLSSEEGDVLQGIKFQISNELKPKRTSRSGIDVRRNDGTIAIISINSSRNVEISVMNN